MPLESPTEPVQTFLEGESYHPTSQEVKRTSELPRGVISQSDFDKAVEALRKANVPPPYKAIYGSLD